MAHNLRASAQRRGTDYEPYFPSERALSWPFRIALAELRMVARNCNPWQPTGMENNEHSSIVTMAMGTARFYPCQLFQVLGTHRGCRIRLVYTQF
jgi:hypothetical protein